MKRILLIFALLFAAPAFAQEEDTASAVQQSQICLLDRDVAEDGKSYRTCAAQPVEDGLLAEGFFGARISRLQLNTTQPIWVHGICKFIDNKAGGVDSFIPFKTAEEWHAFLEHMPKQMTAVGCCTPRALVPADIVTPPMRCAAGWRLKDIRDASGSIIMRIAGGRFVAMDGTPVQLPLLRDDEKAVFTYNGMRELHAYFVCGGGPKPKDPSDEGVLVEPRGDDLTRTGEGTLSPPGELMDMPFSARCDAGEWKTYSARPCFESTHSYSVSCETYGTSGDGEVVIMRRTTCPTGESREEVISNSCSKPGVPAEPVTSEQAP